MPLRQLLCLPCSPPRLPAADENLWGCRLERLLHLIRPPHLPVSGDCPTARQALKVQGGRGQVLRWPAGGSSAATAPHPSTDTCWKFWLNRPRQGGCGSCKQGDLPTPIVQDARVPAIGPLGLIQCRGCRSGLKPHLL